MRRLFAAGADVAIAVAALFTLTARAERLAFRAGTHGLGLSLLLLVLPALYFALRDTMAGRSVGKRLFGLHVGDAAGGAATLSQRLLRNAPFLVAAIPGVGWILGALLVGLSALQLLAGMSRTFGDHLAGTIVVGAGDREELPR